MFVYCGHLTSLNLQLKTPREKESLLGATYWNRAWSKSKRYRNGSKKRVQTHWGQNGCSVKGLWLRSDSSKEWLTPWLFQEIGSWLPKVVLVVWPKYIQTWECVCTIYNGLRVTPKCFLFKLWRAKLWAKPEVKPPTKLAIFDKRLNQDPCSIIQGVGYFIQSSARPTFFSCFLPFLMENFALHLPV